MPISLDALNLSPPQQFVEVVGPVFEQSPWIATAALVARPFLSIDHLHAVLCEAVVSSEIGQQIALIKAHPDLVGRLAQQANLTAESTAEQHAAGLDALTPQEVSTFETYNAAYRKKFGFPFVICARLNRKEAILSAFPMRLANDQATETETALSEIYKIARLRLYDAVTP